MIILKTNGVRRTPNGQVFPTVKNSLWNTTFQFGILNKIHTNHYWSVHSQMNELTTPFATLGGHINSFLLKRDGHRYETFVQSDFAINNTISNLGIDERVYDTKFNFKVLGYIIGEGPNGDRPKIIKRENAVEVKIPRERVILGEIPERKDNKGFYRD